MNEKYKDIMFTNLMKTPSESHIFNSGESRAFELGFTACYDEMVADLGEVMTNIKIISGQLKDMSDGDIRHDWFLKAQEAINKLKSMGVE